MFQMFVYVLPVDFCLAAAAAIRTSQHGVRAVVPDMVGQFPKMDDSTTPVYAIHIKSQKFYAQILWRFSIFFCEFSFADCAEISASSQPRSDAAGTDDMLTRWRHRINKDAMTDGADEILVDSPFEKFYIEAHGVFCSRTEREIHMYKRKQKMRALGRHNQLREFLPSQSDADIASTVRSSLGLVNAQC
jgi:hypothetical protein